MLHYISKFLSIFLTNVYKTSINTTSESDMNSELPAITFTTPTTPRRPTGLSAAVSNVSEMSPLPPATGLRLPSTPVGRYKNGLVPLVANGALVAEVEKVKTELDCVISEVANIKEMVRLGLVEVNSPAPVVPVPAVQLDVTHTLMMRQYDEMRRVMACDQEKMRVFIKNLAIIMAVFVFLMTIVVVSHVHVLVYTLKDTLKEPAVCESPVTALVSEWDNWLSCARIFSKDAY